MDDCTSTANGTNGYLANGTRVQVPDWYRHDVFVVREMQRPSFSMYDIDPGALLNVTEHPLRRLRYLIPSGVLGPVEGDGSWYEDDLTNDRIVTLWVERDGAMWDRLHRARDRYTRSGASTPAGSVQS